MEALFMHSADLFVTLLLIFSRGGYLDAILIIVRNNEVLLPAKDSRYIINLPKSYNTKFTFTTALKLYILFGTTFDYAVC